MKILGITAEYNPFHNGHKYHIEKSKEITGADFVIAVMSGNFTQRGEAAVLDKWQRSHLAVENGVDLVLELPFVFACSGAENFAAGAVDILAGAGATHISFGTECENIDKLQTVLQELEARSANINEVRSEFMSKGYSYARSNQYAVGQVIGSEAAELINTPNNILALEYLKRISMMKYDMKPVAVPRHGSGYMEKNERAGFAGATAVRSIIKSGNKADAARYVPANVFETLLAESERAGDPEESAFRLIRADIVRSSADSLAEIYCMGEGLENKLKKEVIKAGSLQELISSVVSRRYTEAAIRRLMTYILLGIREYEPEKKIYGRLLAAGAKGKELIRIIKQRESAIPLITNINKENELCRQVHNTLKYDLLASDMYNIITGRDLYSFSDRVMKPYIE